MTCLITLQTSKPNVITQHVSGGNPGESIGPEYVLGIALRELPQDAFQPAGAKEAFTDFEKGIEELNSSFVAAVLRMKEHGPVFASLQAGLRTRMESFLRCTKLTGPEQAEQIDLTTEQSKHRFLVKNLLTKTETEITLSTTDQSISSLSTAAKEAWAREKLAEHWKVPSERLAIESVPTVPGALCESKLGFFVVMNQHGDMWGVK